MRVEGHARACVERALRSVDTGKSAKKDTMNDNKKANTKKAKL